MVQQQSTTKPPKPIFETIYGFSPNRDTLGGTAYLIVENSGNILIDAPPWTETEQQFIQEQGSLQWLVITHRGAMGKAREIQKATGCRILCQEQETYLLPEAEVISFEREFSLTPEMTVIWTPGHSPGSSCVYTSQYGGILFSGRHLLPDAKGKPVPLRTAKTFHWSRQLRSVGVLLDRFTPETLQWICPGASIGLLRGKLAIAQGYHQIADSIRE
ncbi:MBL fold metallo-hydrolase [Limnospira fusiformis CCALA 023]|uniref:MBL fold metallo-hydrolase n=1 Tax=Limnospira platensis TaxID=118562 RepID=UPI00396EED84